MEQRFVFSIPDDMHEQLRVLAFKNKSTMAEEIRKAIAEYLRRDNDAKT